MPISERYLKAVGDCLTYHQIIGAPSEVTARNLSNLIMDFQASAGLRVDGDAGTETLWALQFPMVMDRPKLPLVSCKADIVEGIEGFASLRLRQDAADVYNSIYNEISTKGGNITSSGGLRSLSAGANRHRSAKSMHYVGLALDLAVSSGSFKPETDPFVISRHPNRDRYWDVWCRADAGTPMTIEATRHSGRWDRVSIRKETIQGNFIDFSHICFEKGFMPIPPRSGYTKKHLYMSSEWWHFQYETPLIEDFSQIGIELLRIEGYSPGRIQAENQELWHNKKSIFGRNWF